jgi:UPF0176 protein
MAELRNLTSRKELKKRLESETEPRKTLSFYMYHPIEKLDEFRDQCYQQLDKLHVLGRIYIAEEGINAQLSVPEKNFKSLVEYLDSTEFLRNVRLNIAVDNDGKSFWALYVRVRKKIVADGIDDPAFSLKQKGEYLNATEFNELTENPETVIVDMRNYYEYEVGHFENAIEIPSDTFREQLPMAVEMLANKKDQNVVLYCTGGIRCEKASAYFLHQGFTKVFHLEGGIIDYIRTVKEQGLVNKFKGKNFVFDERMAERITEEIISSCHQCGDKCDSHRNCANDNCHLLFIQCVACEEKMDECCSLKCREAMFSSGGDDLYSIQENKIFSNSRKRLMEKFFKAAQF